MPWRKLTCIIAISLPKVCRGWAWGVGFGSKSARIWHTKQGSFAKGPEKRTCTYLAESCFQTAMSDSSSAAMSTGSSRESADSPSSTSATSESVIASPSSAELASGTPEPSDISGSSEISEPTSESSGTSFEDSTSSETSAEEREDLWELCCSLESNLTAECQRQGLRARRLTIENGFDFNKQKAGNACMKLARRWRPRRVWVSAPCTSWTSMQNLNQRNRFQRKRLRRQRLQSRRLVKKVVKVMCQVARQGGLVYFEWPHLCQGWGIPELEFLREELRNMGFPVQTVVFHGCAFNLRSASQPRFFLKKAWRILTTDPNLHRVARVCPKNHRHLVIQGRDTHRSAIYPQEMCRCLAEAFAAWPASGQLAEAFAA